MEIERLISALQELIALLRESRSSDWASKSVQEIMRDLESEIDKAVNLQPISKGHLGFLFAPTGAIQETAIDNGWGEEFLRIAEIVDQFTDTE
ncbi:MAG: hypothetical protein QM730_30790 [Anaerolineales bacterium]